MKIYAFADEASSMIDGQITAMKQNGLDGLEIRNVDNVNVVDISDAKAKEVRGKLDGAGLRVWTIGSPIGKIDIEKGSFEQHTERFKRSLEIAEILGAENIRLFSFFTPGDNRADYKDKVIERLGVFAEIAKGTGITLCHENEKGIYGDVPERCLEIHKALPEIKAIFDPANYVQCGVDTLKAWEMIKPYVKYLHIKDALADGNVVPAGKGIGNLRYILDDFRKDGGDSLTVEPHLTVFAGLKDLEKEGDKSVVGEVYRYPSNEAAFAAACDALKELLA
ncbi:MAG: sugar phosphate isomerase/epimerase [Clostridia bacterium]|nr:sugar phosphate isomerase/epimerase [Clostridia bacterium]